MVFLSNAKPFFRLQNGKKKKKEKEKKDSLSQNKENLSPVHSLSLILFYSFWKMFRGFLILTKIVVLCLNVNLFS